MLRLALRSLRARKLRATLIGVAIMLGTAMISGTYILTDQITGAFDTIFEKANDGVDVIIGRRQEFTPQQTQPGPISEDLVATVQAIDGVSAAEGLVQDLGTPVVDGKPISSQQAPAFVFSTPSERFQTNQVVAGRFPVASGELALEISIADREKLSIGRKMGIQTRTGLKPVTLVGTFRFGESDGIGGAILSAVTREDAQEMVQPTRAGQLHRRRGGAGYQRRHGETAHQRRRARRRHRGDRRRECQSPGG